MKKFYALGGATLDILGRPYETLRYYDSNPGKVQLSLGGVSRNIAENALRCGMNVRLLTVFGDDLFGQLCKQACEELGMDLTYALFKSGKRTASYTALMDRGGEMVLALADMEILSETDIHDFDEAIKTMTSDDICVIDTNFNEQQIEYLAEKIPCFLAMDPISVTKAVKARKSLRHLDVFKPNRLEAEALCGFEIKDEADILKSLQFFQDEGVSEVLLSMGEKGVYLAYDSERYHLWHQTPRVVNTTGAGDAFLAVYLVSRAKSLSPLEACQRALADHTLQLKQRVPFMMGCRWSFVKKLAMISGFR